MKNSAQFYITIIQHLQTKLSLGVYTLEDSCEDWRTENSFSINIKRNLINTEAKRCFATHDEDNDYFNMRIYIILIACVYIQQFNFIQYRPYGTVVNTYAVQSGGCRFESLWGFGFSLKGAYYEVGYCGKKNFLSCTAMHIDFVMCNKGITIINPII